ncbi:hypothetical protein F66182_1902 [Fusarium sp. NRRL 66182]|nr:hypothetical protein F66182_1902 [Fusarium sp. NRRL 66182]
MSWLSQNSELRREDWGLLDLEPAPNEAFVISRRNDACKSNLQASRTRLPQEQELESWLQQVSIPASQQSGSHQTSTIKLLLASKTCSLDELPFTQQEFSSVLSKLKIHGSIVRAINRNTSCAFATLPFSWPSNDSTTPSIVYNCRTAASWDGDTALSVTFFPETLTTNAVWYGCDLTVHNVHGHLLTDAEIITGRLSNFDGQVFHPMILPTIFADFERERQIGLVRKCLTQFVQRINDLATPELQHLEEIEPEISLTSEKETADALNPVPMKKKGLTQLFQVVSKAISSGASSHVASLPKTSPRASSTETEQGQEPAVLLWQNISFLRIGLQNWQTQLRKMMDHVQDLDATNFGIRTAINTEEWQTNLAALREVGSRIRSRLQDLVDEYDEYIRQCTHIMEGLTLATQLELNNIGRKDARTNQEISRVNLEVAQMARHDGNLMKSIATLGMIFLPATFVSWTGESSKDSETLSPYFWIYIVVAVGLTAFTMAVFYTCALRRPTARVDEEYKLG